MLYFGEEKYQEAYDSMKISVEIMQSTLPETHPNLIQVKSDLETIKEKLNNL